jgi:protein-S-isoprenylcysteine O-methyltransferase Ste14
MDRTLIIRVFCLYAPLLGSLFVWNWRKPVRAEAVGALLASAWNVPALLALNVLAFRLGWWRFNASGAMFLGTPVDLWLGWATLWGAVAALLFRRPRVWLACCCTGLCDVAVMPLCAPVVSLGKLWLVGELLGLILCLTPALYFSHWTRERTHVSWRATLQFLTFCGLFVIGVLLTHPSFLDHAGASLLSIPTQLVLQLLFLLALPGVSAVQEFAVVGCGTPLPYDPPVRLVTSGIYSYLANPMQTATVLLLLAVGAALRSPWLLIAAMIAIVYSAGLATWNEDCDMKSRFGSTFIYYRRQVKNWIPRWRPYIASPARIYLSTDCFKCSQMSGFLRDLRPVGLEILPAEEHASLDLERMTYESADGVMHVRGVAALARALEHVNLAWAFAGMVLRLPFINQLCQALADVSGGGPQRVNRRSCSIAVPQRRRSV